MRFRYPDRPIQIFSLSMVREGEWMSQSKWDGHFAIIIKDNGKIAVFSRHEKLLPISAKLLENLKVLDLRDGTMLHGEWTSRREANKEEGMYLFSVVYQNHEWLGGKTEEERYKRLECIRPVSMINVVESRYTGYAEHYKSTIDNWSLEGIVLKKRNAKLIGGLHSPADNPGFLKLKWRQAADGMSKAVVPDDKLVCTI
jgi:ATP-dependent DNA ligase